jgi:hypothetical protein
MKTPLQLTVLAGVLLPCLLLGLGGCAATQVALEHKDLNVQTQMSSTVFLDLESRLQKTVFLEVRNTADRDLAIEPMIKAQLQRAGYQVLSDPHEAFYILQVHVLQVGKADPSALRQAVRSGSGTPLGTALTGAAIGRATGGSHRDLKGAAIGLAAEIIVGALVKNVTYSIITDIQITERTDASVAQKVQTNLHQGTGTEIAQTSESVSNWKKYQTRIVSTANKVNLKFEDALPALEQQLAKSVAGIL